MFKPLEMSEIIEIVRLQFHIISETLMNNQIRLSASEKALEFIAREGFDPQYGARPVKRMIQKAVLNQLSKMILEGKVSKDSEIILTLKNNSLYFTGKS
jgi:ATP-dependent Clp protease ATP-binding subunit ClpB